MSVDDDDGLVSYPSQLEAVKAAVSDARASGACVTVCRAERVGCDGRPTSCADCYVIDPAQGISVEEYLRALRRGNA